MSGLRFPERQMQRGMGGGRMRRRRGICVIESVYLTRSFVVAICGTSDRPSEHERAVYGVSSGLRPGQKRLLPRRIRTFAHLQTNVRVLKRDR